MAFLPHYRVTLRGTFGLVADPREDWSTSFAMGTALPQGAGLVSLPSTAKVDAIVAAATAWMGRTTSSFSTVQHLREVRVAWVGQDGRVYKSEQGAYLQDKRLLTTPVAGTASTNLHPFQIAMVGSLVTARAGAGGRGRMFLPVHAAPAQGDGLTDTATRDGIATSLKTFLDACNSALAGAGSVDEQVRVCVASEGSTLQGRNPSLSRVTSVRVGRVFDTMRSRRRNLQEQYVTQALA